MEALCKDGLQGQPMEQREQCEHAQTLPSDRGRRSQRAISPGQVIKDGLQGQKQSAQGIALGIYQAQPTP